MGSQTGFELLILPLLHKCWDYWREPLYSEFFERVLLTYHELALNSWSSYCSLLGMRITVPNHHIWFLVFLFYFINQDFILYACIGETRKLMGWCCLWLQASDGIRDCVLHGHCYAGASTSFLPPLATWTLVSTDALSTCRSLVAPLWDLGKCGTFMQHNE